MRICRVCGCSEDNACLDNDGAPCHWIAPDTCSCCATGQWAGHVWPATTGRRWLPAEYLDEMPPMLGGTPGAFLGRSADGALQLRPISVNDEQDLARPVVDGETVGFCWHEGYGLRRLLVRADLSHAVDEPIPGEATHFMVIGDMTSLSNSLVDLVRTGGDMGDPLDIGEHMITVYTWSDETGFAVKALESGAADLVQVTK